MTPPQISSLAEEGFRRIVETCFRQEAGASAPFPDETTDLIETGILDSMGWVSFLRAVETASGISLGSDLNEQPSSIAAILEGCSFRPDPREIPLAVSTARKKLTQPMESRMPVSIKSVVSSGNGAEAPASWRKQVSTMRRKPSSASEEIWGGVIKTPRATRPSAWEKGCPA